MNPTKPQAALSLGFLLLGIPTTLAMSFVDPPAGYIFMVIIFVTAMRAKDLFKTAVIFIALSLIVGQFTASLLSADADPSAINIMATEFLFYGAVAALFGIVFGGWIIKPSSKPSRECPACERLFGEEVCRVSHSSLCTDCLTKKDHPTRASSYEEC